MITYERWTKKKVLIVARTYPVPSKTSTEVSCTAGITSDGDWIRLYPVPYRFLDSDKRFRKYQYVEAEVAKSTSDVRPESHKLNVESIVIVSDPIPTVDKWKQRKEKILPLKATSLCDLQKQRDTYQYPTLGLVRPAEISRLKIETCAAQWTESQLTSLRQYSMFGKMPKSELEKIPFVFSYVFKCESPTCRGHESSCTDWEMGALYRKCQNRHGVDWEQVFRDQYEDRMKRDYDTHFFVGTVHGHPDAWIIIGIFRPPKTEATTPQLRLFP